MRIRRVATLAIAGASILVVVINASPAVAWSPETTVAIAEQALILAPPHLGRQLERHKSRYREGVLTPFKQSGGTKQGLALPPEVLRQAIDREAQNAIKAIKGHVPFDEVILRMGVVASYMAATNYPLLSEMTAESRPAYLLDYPAFVESAFPRFSVVFYGAGRLIESKADLKSVIDAAFSRSRRIRPLISLEYDRVGVPNGLELFDDRSTAFGISSMAYSHAVSDVVAVLRYIWLAGGGIDSNDLLPLDEDQLILLNPGGENR
ncbi:MAG: hypothetical protein WBO54_05885 [Thermoanaerobaculia bacterium]